MIETNSGSLSPSSVTFKCYKSYVNSSGTTVTELAPVYWELWGSNSSSVGPGNGTEIQYTSNASSFTPSFVKNSTVYDYYWLGIDVNNYPDSSGDPYVASLLIKTTRLSDIGADSQYVINRFRGEYSSSTTYYYTDASTAGESRYEGSAIIRDYVSYQGSTYFVKSYSSSGISGYTPSSSSSYWEKSSYVPIMTVNTLLA